MSKGEERKQGEKQEKGFLEEMLGDVVNLDRGLPATIWAMLKAPETVITAYFEERGKFTNPFRYTIVILAFTTAITTFFIDYGAMFEQAMEAGAGGDRQQLIDDLRQISNYNWEAYFDAVVEISVLISTKINQIVYILVFAPLLSVFSLWFFKKKEPKFRNHFVMFLYLLATYSIFSLASILIFRGDVFSTWSIVLLFLLQMAYTMYVQGRYLKLEGFSGYFLSFLNFVLGYVSYSIATAVISYTGAYILVAIRG